MNGIIRVSVWHYKGEWMALSGRVSVWHYQGEWMALMALSSRVSRWHYQGEWTKLMALSGRMTGCHCQSRWILSSEMWMAFIIRVNESCYQVKLITLSGLSTYPDNAIHLA